MKNSTGEAQVRRRFLIWLAVLAAVWVLANWPRDGGTLKSWLRWAGFPWTFALWDDGRLVWFNWAALAADVAVLLALVPVAWLCARSRGASGGPQPGANGRLGGVDASRWRNCP
jgi:hypothetical protein